MCFEGRPGGRPSFVGGHADQPGPCGPGCFISMIGHGGRLYPRRAQRPDGQGPRSRQPHDRRCLGDGLPRRWLVRLAASAADRWPRRRRPAVPRAPGLRLRRASARRVRRRLFLARLSAPWHASAGQRRLLAGEVPAEPGAGPSRYAPPAAGGVDGASPMGASTQAQGASGAARPAPQGVRPGTKKPDQEVGLIGRPEPVLRARGNWAKRSACPWAVRGGDGSLLRARRCGRWRRPAWRSLRGGRRRRPRGRLRPSCARRWLP